MSGYLKHAFSRSEIHFAVAKSLEIIGHVTNCCKRPINLIKMLFPYILPPYMSWFYLNQSCFFLRVIFSINVSLKKKKENQDEATASSCLMLAMALLWS